jgi:AcrR family transcriptional regulator
MQVLKEAIRNRILAVAAEEFRLKGFRNASMRGMAERAGMGVSNMYAYYPDKEGIFSVLAADAHKAVKGFIKEVPGCLKARGNQPKARSEPFEEFISDRIIELMRANRMGILLILECAAGTKYSGTRETLVEALAALFMENTGAYRGKGARAVKQVEFLMRILAMNLVQGFMEIARQEKDDAWMEENVRSLIRYHRGGMERFTC